MKTSVSTFNFHNHPIHTVNDSGEIWFRASDIANALRYGNIRKALQDHVETEDVTKRDTLTNGGSQKVNYINESGMYALIFGSKKPEAKQFKRWVTADVLPQIRQTGSYGESNPSLIAQNQALKAELLKARPHWEDIIRYKEIGLTSSEIGKLIERSSTTVNQYVRTMNELGYAVAHNPQPRQLALALGHISEEV